MATAGAQVKWDWAQAGRLGSALPTVVQCARSVDSMIWMLPATEFVAYAK